MKTKPESTSRRDFLKTTAASSVGFTIGFYLPTWEAKAAERLTGTAGDQFEPNAFLRIAADGTVTVVSKHLEMGQGVHTGLPTILADELGADWKKIKVVNAPANANLYKNNFLGIQGTLASSSISNSYKQLREAGAMAREMLISAAAAKLKVDRAQLVAEDGKVKHAASKREVGFGELAAAAAKMPPPANVTLKPASEFKFIGRDVKRLDSAEKTSGQAKFAMDIHEPNSLTALIARPPRFGAKVKGFKADATLKIPGVKDVVQIPQGVAVLAESFWSAKKGREALKIEWDESAAFKLSTADMRTQYRELLGKPGVPVTSKGSVDTAAASATKKISAEIEFPYLAHAPMEPLNCTIDFNGKECKIWSGSQYQTFDQRAAAGILGLPPEKVDIRTTLAGGSFGRRATLAADLVSEAAWIAKNAKVKGRPIHLMWTREDDIRGGFYRPFFLHKIEAGIDGNGMPAFWSHRLVGQSFVKGTPMAVRMMAKGFDVTSVDGVANLAYAVPNVSIDHHMPDQPVPTLWWRSVSHSHTAFAAETIIDELAQLAGTDPVQYRMKLLTARPRMQGVLKLATEKANWGTKPAAGIGRGVAVHECFGSCVAVVVDVSIKDKAIRVERVVSAVDCGLAVNPDIVKAQIEGGIGFGMGHALYGAITFDQGKVVQSNFHDYRVMRMNEMPSVEVHIVPSQADPSGVGEPGVPPIAPAIANAVAALTGKRARSLPLEAG